VEQLGNGVHKAAAQCAYAAGLDCLTSGPNLKAPEIQTSPEACASSSNGNDFPQVKPNYGLVWALYRNAPPLQPHFMSPRVASAHSQAALESQIRGIHPAIRRDGMDRTT
jgi:hypothetical protein